MKTYTAAFGQERGEGMRYNIHYDVAALIVTIAVSLHFFYKKTINTRMTKTLSALIYLAFASNLLDLVTVYTIEYASLVPHWVNYVLNECYLLSFNGITAVYYLYVIFLNKASRKLTVFDKLQAGVPYAIDVLLILSTPVTKFVFYVDDANGYVHGSGMVILYAFAILYVCASLVRTVIYRKNLTRSQRAITYYYSGASLLAIVLQMTQSGLLIVQFAVAIALLLIYLSLENPQDYSNKQTGTYNDMAFMEVLAALFRKQQKFTVIGVQVEGLKYISETLGVASVNQLMKQIAEFLQQICGKKRIFYLSGSQFAVLASGSEAAAAVIQTIQERFQKPFYAEDAAVSLTVPMCMLSYPKTVKTVEDVLETLEYSLEEAKKAGGTVVCANEDTLQHVRRELEIIQIMKKALKEQKFEVWYQPIYSVRKRCFTSAEALIRLIDDEIGFISPEEFIPLAEKNGLILEIGEYVFREVCRFMTHHKIWEYGIEYIDVNLSVVQCMQERMYETLLQIMDEYSLNYQYINLEITETAAVVSRETLERNMRKLMQQGVNFSLDDYGTGFSNTATIIEYPFHTIKMDKSIVWSAMENQKAMYALKYSMAMIKEMQMEIIAEGVETQEQANALEAMGCDFFQGYLYSKPVRGMEFLQKLCMA